MKKTMKKVTKIKNSGKKTTGRKSRPVGNSKPGTEPSPGLKKQYLKTQPVCKVTFKLPKDAAPDADTVTIVGDFNNWNMTETQMKKLKSGDFKATVDLACNREYKFRYLIDSSRWENDWYADKYIPNEHGSDDSVVVIIGNGR